MNDTIAVTIAVIIIAFMSFWIGFSTGEMAYLIRNDNKNQDSNDKTYSQAIFEANQRNNHKNT